MSLLIRAVEKALKTVGLKQMAWNISHARGVWEIQEKSPILLDLIRQNSNGGRIIEFGCGDGSLVRHLDNQDYSFYLGTDISTTAIERCLAKYKTEKSDFYVSSIEGWAGNEKDINILLCEECINYVSIDGIAEFFDLATRSLVPEGVIVIVMHSATKHKKIVDFITENYVVKDRIQDKDRIYLTVQPQKGRLS